LKRNSANTKEYKENRRIAETRSHMVVKSNDLIQNSRFKLSVQEQKIILYLISKIEPGDKEFKESVLSVQDFCKTCGIDFENGGNYQYIKATIKSLSDKSVWISFGDMEKLMRWIYTAEIHKRSGKISIRLSDEIKPYLLELKNRFTRYELVYTLAMKSKYSIRLYELLKSHEYRGTAEFDLVLLKRLIDAENYTRIDNFKNKALHIAIREINDVSDITIEYNTVKTGYRITGIIFKIETKKDFSDRMAVWRNIESIMNH